MSLVDEEINLISDDEEDSGTSDAMDTWYSNQNSKESSACDNFFLVHWIIKAALSKIGDP